MMSAADDQGKGIGGFFSDRRPDCDPRGSAIAAR
jgi:hypothetical protein